MILLPAIDLVAGRCVRLQQGDFARETSYSDDPQGALAAFEDAGASEVHIVDLDGARAGEPRQHGLFAALSSRTKLKLQVAGGFRALEQVVAMIDAGIERVVIGSLALSNPDLFGRIVDAVGPNRITLALDVRIEDGNPMVTTHGWLRGSDQSLYDVLSRLGAVRHLLVTDIAKDGMLAGPNVALMSALVERHPEIALQASGGVAKLGDLDALRNAGAARAIVGKAIWERRFSVGEGIAHASG